MESTMELAVRITRFSMPTTTTLAIAACNYNCSFQSEINSNYECHNRVTSSLANVNDNNAIVNV